MRDGIVHAFLTHDEVAIGAGLSSLSKVVELTKAALAGFLAVQWVVTGTGTCKVEFLASIDGINFSVPLDPTIFATPTLVDPIQEGITAGNAIKGFQPPLCRWVKILFTETGGVNPVTVTNNVSVQ